MFLMAYLLVRIGICCACCMLDNDNSPKSMYILQHSMEVKLPGALQIVDNAKGWNLCKNGNMNMFCDILWKFNFQIMQRTKQNYLSGSV